MAQMLDPVPFVARPGVSKKDSNLALSDRWIDADKTRFIDGKPEKIGGWSKKTNSSVTDAIRGVLCWTTLDLAPFIGLGTHRKLYVVDQSYDPVDITPVVASGNLTDPFTTTNGSDEVNVEHTSHGRLAGDEVQFSGASAVGGITIDGAYEVESVIDDDNYTIMHSSAATGDATGGGTVAYVYLLGIGASEPVEGDGYGAGSYGLYDYGEPTEDATVNIIFEPRVWSLAPYGQLMIANPVNGGIYQFDPTDTPAYVRASAITNAPTVCRSIFVTRERFLFALGVDNDPMNIKWPDQDDITDWTPSATNTANSRRLTEGTKIVGGASIANLLSGVWTDTALYQFQYTGSSFIYDSKCVGTNCGLVSPMALVVNLSIAYWVTQNGTFFRWGGGPPEPIPNSDDVAKYVQDLLRLSGYEFKCNGYYNTAFNEVWWFLVSTEATEPGVYVIASLDDYSWSVGTMTRTSGDYFRSSDQRPLLAGADGYLYQHEDGLDADGEILEAYIERGPLQIRNGAQLGLISGYVNDMHRQTGDVTVEITMYDRIKETAIDTETETVADTDDLVDFEIEGRIASIIVRSSALGGDFRLGAPMLEVRATGKSR